MSPFPRSLLFVSCIVALVLAGCRQPSEQAPPGTSPPPSGPVQAVNEALQGPPKAPKDVAETTPAYILGITYPDGIERHPKLAQELQAYAEAERKHLSDAVALRAGEAGGLPYDMSLSFVTALDNPELVVVRADGSRYTGGAHGQPLLRRFVWLPAQGRMLQAADLLTGSDGWQEVSAAVRESLSTQVSQRLADERLPPAEQAEAMRNALRMIEEGTRPEPAAFSQFEPVLDANGKISALRFVFAPYEVGPYSDGQHSAEVPATLLLPHVAPAYRGLFAGG